MKRGYDVLLILGIICLVGLLYSATVWNSKVQESAQKTAETEHRVTSTDALNDRLDPTVKELFTEKFATGENVDMLIIGSDSIEPVAVQFAETFKKAFGNSVRIDSVTADLTSSEFVAQGLAEVDGSVDYNIVVYEPFTLKNSGSVSSKQELDDLEMVRKQVMAANKDAFFYVTPPQPIPNADLYKTQVDELKQFTSKQSIPFIDHWSKWPAVDSDDLLNYVEKDMQLTEQGVQVWSDALAHTFLK